MPPKLPKKFEGEGNPSEDTVAPLAPLEYLELPRLVTIDPNLIMEEGTRVEIARVEMDVLKKLLDRDRTARLVHGGLKSLLTLSDDDEAILLNFLRRI